MTVREHTFLSWPAQITSTVASDFNITLDQVNWLGNIVALVYLPTALIIPQIVAKYGLRHCVNILYSILLKSITDITKFELGAIALILSAWIRYAGTAKALSGDHAYALLMVGQVSMSIFVSPGFWRPIDFLVFCFDSAAHLPGAWSQVLWSMVQPQGTYNSNNDHCYLWVDGGLIPIHAIRWQLNS